VLTPAAGVDPRDALATSMFAAPGVYAFLVGSGMSTEAGVLTGQRIIDDLIRKVAQNRGIGDVEDDPVAWWEKTSGETARYDVLLEQLAPTNEARRALLGEYFVRNPVTGEPIVPTAAHHALAKLCASGLVRVVLTTNFDRLIEQALQVVGVSPQVLATDTAMASRTPFVHAPVTLVKLHGDHLTSGLLNTEEELGTYGVGAQDLLKQIFDEYGLVVVGWSAEWDQALVAELYRSTSRRYPMYWASYRGDLTSTARRLVGGRRAQHLETEGAISFVSDIVERTDRLGRIAAHHRGPRPTGNFSLSPNYSVPPSGWVAVPLLVVRVATLTRLEKSEAVGLVGPAQRRRLIAGLVSMPLASTLRSIASVPPAWSWPENRTDVPDQTALVSWTPCLEYQSLSSARYQIGGDGSSGVSTVVEVTTPRLGQVGVVKVLFDMGFSLTKPLSLRQVVELLRDGLVAATASVPDSLVDILPAPAHAGHCELHLLASPSGGDASQQRVNDLRARIDLRSLEFPTMPPTPSPSIGAHFNFAADLDGPLTASDALDLALFAMNWMALENGFLDPTIGLRSLYASFGKFYEDD
jgi:hypothetical protein